ncbi:MAG: hypothetical protein M1379_15950 [Firmicutes bacterium]|nr:hypothetical protein [Bacillota bacterium]
MKKRLIACLVVLALAVPTLTGCLNNSRSQVVVKPPATDTTSSVAETPAQSDESPAPVQSGASNPYSDTLAINSVFDRLETGMATENAVLVAGLFGPAVTLKGSPGAPGAPGATSRKIPREQLQSELTQDLRLTDYPRYTVVQRKISMVNNSSALVEGTLQIRRSSATATVDSINSMVWTLVKYAAGWQIVSTETRTSQALTITGAAAYRQKVLAALDLLQNRAPKYLTQVKSSLVAIHESQRSGAQVQIHTFELSDATLQASDSYWIASVIVHDAYHVTQYLQGRPYSGQQAEVEALAQQKAALIAMGAPQRYIDYVQQVAQTQYWNVPYGQRNW